MGPHQRSPFERVAACDEPIPDQVIGVVLVFNQAQQKPNTGAPVGLSSASLDRTEPPVQNAKRGWDLGVAR